MGKDVFDMTKNISVAVFYRPQNTDGRVFVDVLNNFIDMLKKMLHNWRLWYWCFELQCSRTNFSFLTCFILIIFPLINRSTRVTQSIARTGGQFRRNWARLSVGFPGTTQSTATVIESLHGLVVTDISDHFPIAHINWSHTKEKTETCMNYKMNVSMLK